MVTILENVENVWEMKALRGHGFSCERFFPVSEIPQSVRPWRLKRARGTNGYYFDVENVWEMKALRGHGFSRERFFPVSEIPQSPLTPSINEFRRSFVADSLVLLDDADDTDCIDNIADSANDPNYINNITNYTDEPDGLDETDGLDRTDILLKSILKIYCLICYSI
ncbi:13872_t:CDS:2 [Funneliformis mosseae]|uniref:13872_t:CDS:1 n=1 Tax=Funneliformis mosseae TaxID=27381 RepID=A0A9N8VIQ0_FUNMO|nr:13872_t:CDS:2 [Funneliformis mosseae]